MNECCCDVGWDNLRHPGKSQLNKSSFENSNTLPYFFTTACYPLRVIFYARSIQSKIDAVASLPESCMSRSHL